LVAGVAAIAVRRTGAENLAFVLFLVGVAAEVVLFFEEEPVFAFQEIGSGEACDATADDDDVCLLCCVRFWERVAVANLVADRKVLALDDGRCGCSARFFEKRFVDRAAGSDRAGDYILDETAA